MFKGIIFLVLSSMTLNPSYQLGGTSVGNGGGFAEMQVAYLNQLFPSILKDHEPLSDFYSFLLNQDSPSLNFDENCVPLSRSYIISYPNNIPSCLLYTDEASQLGPKPKPISELAAIIFAIRWIEFSNESSLDEALNAGKYFFSKYQWNEQRIPLNWRSQSLASVVIWDFKDIQNSNLSEQQVSLELKDSTIDIKPLLKKSLSCSHWPPFEISYLTLREVHLDNLIYATGPIVWKCDSVEYEGELNLKIIKGNGHTPNIQVWILSKKVIEKPSN